MTAADNDSDLEGCLSDLHNSDDEKGEEGVRPPPSVPAAACGKYSKGKRS